MLCMSSCVGLTGPHIEVGHLVSIERCAGRSSEWGRQHSTKLRSHSGFQGQSYGPALLPPPFFLTSFLRFPAFVVTKMRPTLPALSFNSFDNCSPFSPHPSPSPPLFSCLLLFISFFLLLFSSSPFLSSSSSSPVTFLRSLVDRTPGELAHRWQHHRQGSSSQV